MSTTAQHEVNTSVATGDFVWHELRTTDAKGEAPATDACTPDDVSATLFHSLGINPHQELTTPGRNPTRPYMMNWNAPLSGPREPYSNSAAMKAKTPTRNMRSSGPIRLT